ncbi:isocitrate lyase/phosphoenolpyruvate mutase family protein [Streptomyces sp. ICBB 8177]|uniref:isocitrate lyase/PEP mutase family protein n=1 Tax=Streptomyces sp. ICBB 8177 TaxID=563922 RepID=UPI000D680AC4|nr:isocitrate lyase/phosphoenolpyruvate mutase family protein [Streptomyces sp. ICBB 8177]PWI45997.1 3-methyl-2-oxobutanoate hydroxymethyltransferase [Streptomyces sp. ICBB 8177]
MTNAETQRVAERARRFRELHTADGPLVLPNAWDAASARVIERAGARAIATTSSGVAWGLGAPDGEGLPLDTLLGLCERVVAAVDVPVSADLVAGYGADPAGVARTVERALAAGVVGVNLEDSGTGPQPLRPAAEQAERIAAARAAADDAGVPLYVNARVDTYLRAVGPAAERLDATLERAAAYVAAGADGVFVPGTCDPDTVAALAKGVDAPLALLAGPGAPPVAELARAGAARISVGGGIAAAAYALASRAASELLTSGTYGAIEDQIAYGTFNELFQRG